MDRFDINKTEGHTRGLQIMLSASSKDLIDLFGRAQAYNSCDKKITRMWGIKIKDTMFAVYDYKYHPKKSDEVSYWNVGLWYSDESYNYTKIRRTVLKFLKESEKEHKNLKVIDLVADWKYYLRTGKMIIY